MVMRYESIRGELSLPSLQELWQNGFGILEKGAECKIGARQKHKGMSWSPTGSKALGILKVVELNQQWEQLWFPQQAAA